MAWRLLGAKSVPEVFLIDAYGNPIATNVANLREIWIKMQYILLKKSMK